MELKMFNVGKIVNTHGIAGEVRVIRITDFEERFQEGQALYWYPEEKSTAKGQKLIVKSHRKHKNFDLIAFEGYMGLDQVENFKGGILKIREDQLSDLEEDEYYYHEIIGCQVVADSGEQLGTVKEILSPGANDVWVIQRQGKNDLLIPYIEDVVTEVDIENKHITIHPMEGLLD